LGPAVAATVPTVPRATTAVAVTMAARLVMERRVIAVSSFVRFRVFDLPAGEVTPDSLFTG